PILDEFIAASKGLANRKFWQSIYKLEGGSGGPYISGWMNAFFPYLKNWETSLATDRNPWMTEGGSQLQELYFPSPEENEELSVSGPTTESFPGGLARASIEWNYRDQSYPMEFWGGFVGVRQDRETRSVRPEIGWAVRPAPAQ
ncbi:MAG TPA: DUF4419 domain-containing protein, partial [Pirellulales bacterium]